MEIKLSEESEKAVVRLVLEIVLDDPALEIREVGRDYWLTSRHIDELMEIIYPA